MFAIPVKMLRNNTTVYLNIFQNAVHQYSIHASSFALTTSKVSIVAANQATHLLKMEFLVHVSRLNFFFLFLNFFKLFCTILNICPLLHGVLCIVKSFLHFILLDIEFYHCNQKRQLLYAIYIENV